MIVNFAADTLRSNSRGTTMKKATKKKSALLWLFEPLLDDPRLVQRQMFSFDTAYRYGAALCGNESIHG